MTSPDKELYEFGPFRLDATEGLLWRDKEPVALTPKAFEMLLLLVKKSGRVVEKDEFIRTIWPDTFIEEGVLTVNISLLRKTLGDDRNGHKYIETVPRRGYRFVAEVRDVRDEGLRRGTETSSEMGALRAAEGETSPRNETKDEAELASGQRPFTVSAERVVRTGRGRKLTVIAICLLLAGLTIALSFAWESARGKKDESLTEIKSIAVLPFKHLDGAGGDAALELGMADALITKLSNTRKINVRPTRAILKYADQGIDPLVAGRELGVDALLFGSVQKSDDRIRVTVQLVRVRDEAPLWAEAFDERFVNVFAVQDRISEQAAHALTLKLTGEEQAQLKKRYTESIEAYEAYLRGRYFWNKRTDEGLKKAVEHFQQAVDIDPTYALAYAGLAETYVLLGPYNVLPREESFPKAKAFAAKALELDDTLAEAHTAFGLALFSYDWNLPESERAYHQAIKLNPNYATAHHWYGYYNLSAMGCFDEAIAEIKKAVELDPLSLIINTNLGATLLTARRYDEAIEQLQKTLELDPNFVPAHYNLHRAYLLQGRYEEAIAEWQKCYELNPDPGAFVELGHAYALAGRRSEAEQIIAQLRDLLKERYNMSYVAALIYTALRDKDQAFAWLDQAFKARTDAMLLIKVDPFLDPLRADPRFPDLVRRVESFSAEK